MTEPRRRNVALVLAGLLLLLAAPADAKKKKKGGKKHHKTPSSKSVGADSKQAIPDDDDDDDESGSKDTKESGGAASESTSAPSPEAGGGGEAGAETSAPKPKKAASSSEEGEVGGTPPALRLVVGGGAVFRKLAWADDRSGMLAPYSLTPGPEARLSLEVYPAAFATAGFAANIGIFVDGGYGFAVKSQSLTGAKLTTKFYDFLAGLKIRVPLGTFEPYFSVAYGNQAFRLEGQGPTTGPPVPGVNYKFIRVGIGTRVYFTPMIDLNIGGGFDLVSDPGSGAGDIKTSAYFPRANAYAMDAGLSLGVRLSSLIGLRAGGEFRQYGYTLNWEAGQPYQIGGAIDRFITAWGGLEIILDGVPDETATPASGGTGKRRPPAETEETPPQ